MGARDTRPVRGSQGAVFLQAMGRLAAEVRRTRPGWSRVESVSGHCPVQRRGRVVMVAVEDYLGREQSYVKHVFLERYLERLAHKTASTYPHVVYVDGFA